MIAKLNVIWVGLIILLISSCDFSTHEYISYEGYNRQHHSMIYVGWGSNEDSCSVSFMDTSFVFDYVELEFPSNHSRFKSEFVTRYSYYYEANGIDIKDTTVYTSHDFVLGEKDSLVTKNHYVMVYFFRGKKMILQDTLYRQKTTSEFIDRLPLPKLH
jgi:hypothetical protein